MTIQEFDRRGFLKGLGVLIAGYSVNAELTAQTAAGPPYPVIAPAQVDSWVAIASDGSVTGLTGKCDFGQGFGLVQKQLVAEELGVPFDRVRMIICDTAFTPDQGVSSGSLGHPANFSRNSGLRQALATARETLVRMASEQLNVPVDDLTVDNGMVISTRDASKRISYGTLIGNQRFAATVSNRAIPRDPETYKVLGRSIPREDIPFKVDGTFEYVHHVRVPGMLHGRVVRPPSPDAKVVSVDEASVSRLPGNVRVVVKGDFVGVVADGQWQAIRAAETLKVNWSNVAPLPKFENIHEYVKAQPSRDNYIVRAADMDEKFASARRVITAAYKHPYQMHGSLGTSCAVADVRDGSATIWSATQGVYPQRDSVAVVLGIPANRIRVIHKEGSGCYGINGADTVSYDAALLSQAVGKPVRVQLSRKDENTGAENYGPAYVINLKAAIGDDGLISAWDYEGWTLSKGGRPNAANPGNIPTGALVGRPTPPVVPTATPTVAAAFNNNSNAASAYGTGCVGGACGGTGRIRSERVLVHTIQSPFFTGPLRSPNRLQNSFANESFMDEVASALGHDPLIFRRMHLSDPRMIDVMHEAAVAAKWESRPSPKRGNPRTGVVTGRGMAILLYEGDNGYSCVIAEVDVNQASGAIVVKKFYQSQDSGPVSNPDGLKNQMEGGTLQGMSRAMREEVRWDDFGVTSVDWRRYNAFRFGEFVPEFVNVLLDRKGETQMGAGEGTITIAAAAIANAVFDATGARLREVPFTPDRVLAALRARPA
ncbi:MAG: xanthine dehydrogenase family protein molybdopterin-binding subunit [Acidobacteria bacterium]|nr:xanthine dehydrogenase family protein molybdopterin-binding subunit [Acidobacteriota bacterium]